MADDVMREVDQLLKDREKYEAWLNRLESEKTGASGPAYEKVRGDYQQRFEEVLGKLRAHSESIQGKLKGLENKVAELDSQRSGRSEKLDEAQLRRSVGEYEDDKAWNKLESELVGSLKESEKELEAVGAEIGRLEEIVAQVKGAEARPAAKPEPAPEPEPEPVAVASEPEPVEPEPAPEPVVAASGGGFGDDEGLISLEELVLEDDDMKEVSVKAEPTPDEPSSTEKGESAEGGVGDELAFLESLSLGGTEEAESFTFLEQRGSGTPQTIICPHCSAANDPAEWYCTECGEELPAE